MPSRSFRERSSRSFALLVFLLAVVPLAAQAPVRDAPYVDRSVTVHGPTGSWTTPGNNPKQMRALVIRSDVVWRDGNFRVRDGSSPCALVVERGGRLTIERSHVEVMGDVYLAEGGTLRLVDTEFRLANRTAREFHYWWAGGHFDTERSVVGGTESASGAPLYSNFLLSFGLWTARDTTVQYSSGVMLTGSPMHPQWKGGRLVADGLYGGVTGDTVTLSGEGEAVLANSTMWISLVLHARGGKQVFDLESERRIPLAVYGDPTLHDARYRPAVTHPIPGCTWRLELRNHLAPGWRIALKDVVERGQAPDTDIVLRGGGRLTIAVHARDLVGTPKLVGPWRNFFPAPTPLPMLPTVETPGHHAIPPGCGVQIGSVTIEAPGGAAQDPSSWLRVGSWDLQFVGSRTDFEVRGPGRLVEVHADEGARLRLSGSSGYDLGVGAAGLVCHRGDGTLQDPNVTIRDAVIGFPWSTASAQIYGKSAVKMQRVIVRNLELLTRPENRWPQQGMDEAIVRLENFHELTAVRTDPSPGGTIQVVRANRDQATTLENLDLEEGVRSNGLPDHWAGAACRGGSSSSVRPGTRGSRSFAVKGSASAGEIRKELSLPRGALVEFRAWVFVRSLPNGARVRARARGSSGTQALSEPAERGTWTKLRTPPFVVGSNDTRVDFALRFDGAPSNGGGIEFVVDDVEIEVIDWASNHSLANLDFEEPFRSPYGAYGASLGPGLAPPYWGMPSQKSWPDTSQRRPNSPGKQSIRCELGQTSLHLNKDLSDLQPGQRVHFSGWVRGSGASSRYVNVHVGEGDHWGDPNHRNNQSARIPIDGRWHHFSLTYVVPSSTNSNTITKLAITGKAPGAVVHVDDCHIEVQS